MKMLTRAALASAALLAVPAIASANVGAVCADGDTVRVTFTGFDRYETNHVPWSVTSDGRVLASGKATVRGTGAVLVDLPGVTGTLLVAASWGPVPSRDSGKVELVCTPTPVPPTAPEPPAPTPPTPVPAEVPPAPTPAPPLDELGPPDNPPAKAPSKARPAPLPRPTVCRTWARKPANGVARGVPRPGSVRVRYVDGRWYGFRGDRFERVKVRGRVVVVFRPGVPCFRVQPEVTG